MGTAVYAFASALCCGRISLVLLFSGIACLVLIAVGVDRACKAGLIGILCLVVVLVLILILVLLCFLMRHYDHLMS